ncbi:hypothetical protein N9166_01720 [bacterium]|nr:hypothetical protein [bacterium]
MDRGLKSAEAGGGGRRARLAERLRAEPLPLSGARPLRTALRTGHIIAFAALYGGHIYGIGAGRLLPALLATVATGGALMALEVYQAPVWLAQIRGLATFAKLVLVVSVAFLWDWRIPLLTLVVVIGTVNSHMPGRYRYYSPLHGRIVGSEEKG